jgi:hypothetical protein
VREIGPAFSAADSSAVDDAPDRVAVSKGGAGPPHSIILGRLVEMRNIDKSLYFHIYHGKMAVSALFSSTSWKGWSLTFLLYVFSTT